MPLKNRILLLVSSLFLVTIVIVFSITYLETEVNLRKIDSQISKHIEKNDDIRFENIKKYLSINVNDVSEKIYQAFESLRIQSQWTERFVPNEYNITTNSWGSSAAFLSTFAELDLINVNMNGNVGSFIHFSRPFVHTFARVNYSEGLTFFCRKECGECKVYIGVPFWSNEQIHTYLSNKQYDKFLSGYNKSNWLIYEIDTLLDLDIDSLEEKNDRIFTHLFDAAITIHSKEEFAFLVSSTKKMLAVTQEKLRKEKSLIKSLQSPRNRENLFTKALKRHNTNVSERRKYCRGPLCDYSDQLDKKDVARSDFVDFSTQRELTWKICMITRTGLWGFSPLDPRAPIGAVSSLLQTSDRDNYDYQNEAVGMFSRETFIPQNAKVDRTCKLEFSTFSKRKTFTDESGELFTTCKNDNLSILYNETLKQPFLSSTFFISSANAKDPKFSAVTLGISLDNLLINLALASPNDVLFISKQKDIRYFQGDSSKNVANTSTKDRHAILNNKEGVLTSEDGEKIFFRRIAQITKDDGYIVLIETQSSRAQIIDTISNLIRYVSKHSAIHSAIFIIVVLIILIFLLNLMINSITKPIKKLSSIASVIGQKDINEIEIDPPKKFHTSEIRLLYSSFQTMVENMKEAEQVRGLLDKVVSKEVVKKILNGDINLSGEMKNISVMFCDIRNFTEITEKMNPQDVLIMLNECLTLLSHVIDNFEGIIDKYEGDKIMTLFGAPIEIDDHELEACLCAIEMQKTLATWNEKRKIDGFVELHMGIGIHAGVAVAGNVGATNHLSYTVLGHIVNLSSRLCDSAKGDEILVSAEIYEKVKDKLQCTQNPPREFKGVSETVVTYSVHKRK